MAFQSHHIGGIGMKAITLHQPWASLIAQGYKQYETRSWTTNYRGLLLIHAGKRPMDDTGELLCHVIKRSAVGGKLFMSDTLTGYRKEDYPLGCIVAVCQLADCIRMDWEFISQQTGVERVVGWWETGRFAWELKDIKALPTPIPAIGKQGLWIPSSELVEKLGKTLAEVTS